MRGLRPAPDRDDPLGLMSEVLDAAGFTSVVATNCEQAYHRVPAAGGSSSRCAAAWPR